jgi:large subunit ribosomal protein L22
MEVMCKAKFIRIAPRKTRLLAGLVRGLSVEAARQQLRFSSKQAAQPMLKAINSAVANAVHNHKHSGEGLYVSRILVDEGPKIKRYMPRAQGRATPIRHRMSHITVWVSDVKASAAPAKDRATTKVAKAAPKKVAKAKSPKSRTAKK